MMACPSIYCVTESPTLSPTISAVPTASPTISMAPTTKEPTTDAPSATTTSLAPTTYQPIAPSSGFIFSVDTTNNGQDDHIESIPLSPFRLDFILLVDDDVNSHSNDGRKNKKTRRTLLRGSTTTFTRELQSPTFFFQPAQDAELLSLVSDHLLDQFTKNMVLDDVEGKPMSVELGIDDKVEQAVRDGKVMVSYGYIGHAVYATSSSRNSMLPTTEDLDSDVLNAFNSRVGKRAWLNTVQYSDDEVLQDIVNVIASNNPILTVDQAVETNNEIDLVDGSGSDATTTTASFVNPIVAIIAVAFATTLLIIGFLTYRKYQRYKRSNINNDYLNYQARKRNNKSAIETNVKNRKRYDHFESPEGSVVAPIGEEEHINDLEIVGGDTYPASQDYSDADPTTTTTNVGRQFHPNHESLPFDEELQQNTTAASSSSMVYYSHAANQMMMQDDANNNRDDETLEGLYSDKDSYFQSTFAPSVIGQQMYGDGIHSVHSLDTLDNTFGFTTAQSMDALDNPEEKITHLIEGFEEIMDRNERESSSSRAVEVEVQDLPTTVLPIDNNICHDANNNRLVDEPVVEDSPEESNVLEDSSSKPNVVERRTSTEESDESIKTEAPSNTSNTSDTSDTDELFARITELENKMIQTESSLKTSTFDETTDSDELLYSRITELENKMCQTESKLASASMDEMDTKAAATTYDTEKLELSVPPNTPTAPVNTLEGIFTAETLVKIEENRLQCTPPPSEGEVDNDIIKAAKENTLLGKFLDESSDDDSSLFEK